jgi:Transposase
MKYTESKREEILAAFANRPDSVESFARRHGVSVNTLYLWRDAQRVKPKQSELVFRPIEPPSSVFLPVTVEIGGVMMIFSTPPDAGWFAEVIKRFGTC